MRRRGVEWTKRALVHGVLIAASAVMLAPLAWMLSTSLKGSTQSLGRGVQWLPWQDYWVHDGRADPVVVVGARVKRPDTGEVLEVGATSIRDRRRHTVVSLPEETFEGKILEFRVRPASTEGETGAAAWRPFAEVEQRFAPRWDNYREAFEKMQFFDLLRNTAAITYLGTLGTLLSCSMVAYGFARFRFPGRALLFLVLLSGMMLPGVVTMIPVYLIFRQLRWIDTLLPLFVPAWFGINAFAVFLFRQFFMSLPFDLDDAARIDGCNAFRIYWSVLLPLSKPVLATVAIFSFTGYWLDFMTPLIYLNSLDKFTLSLGLYMFKGPYTVEWNYLMAATLAVSLPCILLFLFGQRFFISGVVMSGMKG
jgi:multiple sugar transport system permease protein